MGKEKDDEIITLNDEYSIRKISNGFALEFVSKVVSKKRVRGEMKETRNTATKYYGNLFQALQGFVKSYYEKATSVEDIVVRVEEAMAIINSATEAINSVNHALVEKYKIVKVSNN